MNLQALETSFDLVAPRGDELVDDFYERLFTVAPAVKPLFAETDLKRQKTISSARSSCSASPCAISIRSCRSCAS